jgi:hypothetical protein
LENRPELDRPSSHHQIIESAQRNRNKWPLLQPREVRNQCRAVKVLPVSLFSINIFFRRFPVSFGLFACRHFLIVTTLPKDCSFHRLIKHLLPPGCWLTYLGRGRPSVRGTLASVYTFTSYSFCGALSWVETA